MNRLICIIFIHFTVFTAVCAEGLSRQDKARYAYFFQGAISRLNLSDEAGAFDLLMHCKEIDPDAAETYYYLSDCYEHLGNDSLRVAMLIKASELSPDNDVYKEQLLPLYLNDTQLDKAVAVIEDILSRTPERTDMLQVLIQIYAYQENYAKTLETLNRLEVQEGQSEQLTMSKVQMYTKMGDDKRAYKELKSLCDNHPLDLNYRVMLGNWLLGKDRKKEALEQYQSVLDEEPENEMALMSMMDYYRSEKLDSLADKQRDNLLLSPLTQQSTRLLLLKQYIMEQEHISTDSTAVLQLFDRVLSQHDDMQIMELKLAYMTLKKMPEENIKALLTQMLDKRPEHSQARMQLLEIANNKGDFKEMIRLAKPAQQFNPDEWAFSYFLGFAYVMEEDYVSAVKALEVACENVDESSDERLAVELYAILGEAYYKLGQKEQAYKAYDDCLRLDPDNIMTLNNYAYYLAEDNLNLDRAAAMSLKTVKAEPTNATYLDTYAWVLYMQERYAEAKIYIDMAIDNMPEDTDKTVYFEHRDAINKKLETTK